jgi:hypothetical protein
MPPGSIRVAGRDGRCRTDDGWLDVNLAIPREMEGASEGTNLERLFCGGLLALPYVTMETGGAFQGGRSARRPFHQRQHFHQAGPAWSWAVPNS